MFVSKEVMAVEQTFEATIEKGAFSNEKVASTRFI